MLTEILFLHFTAVYDFILSIWELQSVKKEVNELSSMVQLMDQLMDPLMDDWQGSVECHDYRYHEQDAEPTNDDWQGSVECHDYRYHEQDADPTNDDWQVCVILQGSDGTIWQAYVHMIQQASRKSTISLVIVERELCICLFFTH